jgi:hypothetical protein
VAEFHLFLDAQTLSASNAIKRGLLTIPTADENDTLFQRSETDKKWREHFEVKATDMKEWEQDKAVGIVTVQYKVTDEHYPTNKNKIMTKSYFINSTAIKEGAGHKEYKRTMMNIGKLNALIRASGVELEKDDNGRVPYHNYFNGEDKPLIGKRFWGIVRDYTYKNRNEEVVNDQDIDNYLPEHS